MKHRILIVACTIVACTTAACTSMPPARAAFTGSGFLTDYRLLEPVSGPSGTDFLYTAPEAVKRIARHTGVMIDQPEIHFSADSEYRGMKPKDLDALATIMRDELKAKVEAGGHYAVVDQPGADVLYLRTALTELYLKKKKRPVLAYTPVGAVAKAGIDALKETLAKVDIIEMALEAEITDSESGEVLAALVVERGARKGQGEKEERMDVNAFRALLAEYGARLRCRLDNARLSEAQWIDCTDPRARQAREATS